MRQRLILILIGVILVISYSASGQSTSEFKAKLLDFKTQAPVSNARIILALKTKDKPECVINTKLTAVSKENGEVLIPNIPVGDYVIFYNLSGSLDNLLTNKVIGYDPVNNGDTRSGDAYTEHIYKTLGSPINVMSGGKFRIVDGNLVIDGYFYAEKFDLGMISKDGKLMQVEIPLKMSEELSIELNTEIGKTK